MRALRHKAPHLRGGELNIGPVTLTVDAEGVLYRKDEDIPWEPTTEAERARFELFKDDFEDVTIEERPYRGRLTVIDPLADLEAATKALGASTNADLREIGEAVQRAVAAKLEQLTARRAAPQAAPEPPKASAESVPAAPTTETPAPAGKGKGK